MNDVTLDEAIKAERARRLDMVGGYHYWKARGDDEPPREEVWCDYCAGFFGVPHDGQTHPKRGFCRNLGRFPGNRQCACIDCVVWEEQRAVAPTPEVPRV